MSTMSSLGKVELPQLMAPSVVGVLGPGASRWPARILVCTDNSVSSGDALALADALAARAAAAVDVLSVFTPSIPLPNVPARRGSARCERQDRCAAAELIRAVRTEERRRFGGRVRWPVNLEVGNPVQAIVERSKRTRADLVIVGLGSRDPLVRKGGVVIPASLSRYTDVPILAAAPMVRALPQEAVLLVDREQVDLAVIRAALRCIEDASFLWVLVHAGTTANSGDGVQRRKGTLADIMSVIRREAATVSKRIVARAVYRTGDPVEAVLALAREVRADLIVTPVHGTAGPVRSLLPNVADRLLLAAPCSVLVVPES